MMTAAFMDIFGFIGFAVLLIMGIGISRAKKLKIRREGDVVIIIAIIGLLVDSYIVLTNFILK